MNDQNTLIDDTLDNLIEHLKEDEKRFFKIYKSLPIEIFKEIERLSSSKSYLKKDRCDKARFVADSFHKQVK